MSGNAKNFHAHGGSEWVVGGKLTFLPGAVVEGVDGLFDLLPADMLELDTPVLPCIPVCEATTVAQLKECFNQLIAAMKGAGIMASEFAEAVVQIVSPESDEEIPAPDSADEDADQ